MIANGGRPKLLAVARPDHVNAPAPS